jgi:hypothetical protein
MYNPWISTWEFGRERRFLLLKASNFLIFSLLNSLKLLSELKPLQLETYCTLLSLFILFRVETPAVTGVFRRSRWGLITYLYLFIVMGSLLPGWNGMLQDVPKGVQATACNVHSMPRPKTKLILSGFLDTEDDHELKGYFAKLEKTRFRRYFRVASSQL